MNKQTNEQTKSQRSDKPIKHKNILMCVNFQPKTVWRGEH